MIIEELMDYLKQLPPSKEVKFTDVCGNWEFDLYQVLQDEKCVYIVGDEDYR